MSIYAVVSFCGIILLSALPAGADALPRFGIFNYAKMCHSNESGDWDGTRIVLVRMKEADFVLFENAEGAVFQPIVGNLTVGKNGQEVSFSLPNPTNRPENPITFHGKFNSHRLTGILQFGETPGRGQPVDYPMQKSGESEGCERNQ